MIADFHARAIESLPNATMVGFCNIRKERAVEMAKKYGAKSWDTISAMLQSDEIEVAMIATPSGAHMESVIEAAKYGKPGWCATGCASTGLRITSWSTARARPREA